MTQVRTQVIRTYAEWTAFSALRSGRHVKDGATIYPALRRVPFEQIFDLNRGPIHAAEFASWHRSSIEQLRTELSTAGVPLPAGWAAKLVNVYLKTRAYVANAGRPGLVELLHPPVDGGLWKGIRRRYRTSTDKKRVLALTHSRKRIKDIQEYAEYETIIAGCRLVAADLGCSLIEVDQLWIATEVSAARADMPQQGSEGMEFVLWDSELNTEISGTVTRYDDSGHWFVRISDE